MLLQEESQRGIVSETNIEPHLDTTALSTTQKGNKVKKNWNVVCDFCHVKGHDRKVC